MLLADMSVQWFSDGLRLMAYLHPAIPRDSRGDVALIDNAWSFGSKASTSYTVGTNTLLVLDATTGLGVAGAIVARFPARKLVTTNEEWLGTIVKARSDANGAFVAVAQLLHGLVHLAPHLLGGAFFLASDAGHGERDAERDAKRERADHVGALPMERKLAGIRRWASARAARSAPRTRGPLQLARSGCPLTVGALELRSRERGPGRGAVDTAAGHALAAKCP